MGMCWEAHCEGREQRHVHHGHHRHRCVAKCTLEVHLTWLGCMHAHALVCVS